MNKIAWSACILACTLTFSGCAMPKRPLVERPATSGVTNQAPAATTPDLSKETLQESPVSESAMPGLKPSEELPSLPDIDRRLTEYGKKLERWKELDRRSAGKVGQDNETAEMISCFRKLQNVIQGYNEVRARILQAGQMVQSQRTTMPSLVELQKKDLEFMESSCGRMLSDQDGRVAEVKQSEENVDLAQLETQIDHNSAAKDYQEVVKAWQRIPPAQLGRISLRSKINYGNALVHLRQEAKAAEIYQQVVDQMSAADEPTDLVSLRKVLADLYMASGNTKAAAIQYQKISEDYQKLGRLEEWSKLQLASLDKTAESGPEMKEYTTLLRNYLSFGPEKDGYKVVWQAEKYLEQYPYSPVAANVEAIKNSVKAAADKWFDGVMAGVNKLAGDKKFKEARDKLDALPVNLLGPEQQLMAKGKKDELLMGETVDKETDRIAQVQDLQNQWNKGLLLVGEEKYEDAIAVFTALLDTEYAAKAQAKIKEVSLAAAQADRKKAANLFVRFGKTTDIESKKKLLLESRKILKDILVKYPNVEIAPKVVSNIERVEQEMVAIDPAMLVMADQPESSRSAGPDGSDRVFAPPAAKSTEPETTNPKAGQ